MAAAGTNPKIEELRFKLKTDPKSRLFYPLAEELRKAGQFAEAEQVLRAGLSTHATYLSAWVVLGRVLREQGKHADAVTALTQALNLDRGNVVAARLLAESYISLGEKVEAIKKYKLIAALMPGDAETEAAIAQLQNEISSGPRAPAPPPPAASAAAPPAPVAAAPAPPPIQTEPETEPFDITYSRLKKDHERERETGDLEPMRADHEQSPFEEPAADSGYSADAFALEDPSGMHLAAPPLGAEMAEPFPLQELPPETSPVASAESDEVEFNEPATEVAPGFIQGRFDANVPPPPAAADDFARTITMADLYASQGLIDEARDIYEDVLARDPDNAVVLAKLQALEDMGPASQQEPWKEEEPASEEPAREAWSGGEPAREESPFGMKPPEDEEPTLELRHPQIGKDAGEVARAPLSAAEDRDAGEVARAPLSTAENRDAGEVSTAENPESSGRVKKLESWLSKVKRPGVGSV
mgnify:CR=1 FL=1